MDWTTLNWVDWLFVAVLLYGAVMGAIRGLSHELATLIGMVAAVLVTRLFYEPIADTICDWWGWNPELTRLLAVVALMLLTLYGMRLLRIALGTLMTFAFKGLVERLGGLLTGMVLQGMIFLVVLLGASHMPFENKLASGLQRAVMLDSHTGRVVLPYLVVGYNEIAQRLKMIQAQVPLGVEQPYAVMPPEVEPAPADDAAK